MKITSKTFLADVLHELTMLRDHANEEEKVKLDLTTFDPERPQTCIYGQLTGTCTSVRAKELMDKCCIRVMDFTTAESNDFVKSIFTGGGALQKALKFVNGENKGQGWKDDGGTKGSFFSSGSRDYHHLSVLEAYIFLKRAKPKELIAYLKGEIETIKL